MKVVYIAGPFRSKTGNMFEVQQNIMEAMKWSLLVWNNGGAALCPHANTVFFTGAAPDTVWLEGDIELLKRCDAILLIPGWHNSPGSVAEYEVAAGIGMPKFDFDYPGYDGSVREAMEQATRERLLSWLKGGPGIMSMFMEREY
jgi:hypothetical protein